MGNEVVKDAVGKIKVGHVPTADELEKKLAGLAGMYVINLRRPNTPLRDISRVPEIMDLIEDQRSGKLLEKNPTRPHIKWHMKVTAAMWNASIFGRTTKKGQYMTLNKADALKAISQFHWDPLIGPDQISLPLTREEIQEARENARIGRNRLAELEVL